MSYLERLMAPPKGPDPVGWKARHMVALSGPLGNESIVHLLYGWVLYADYHKTRYESGIGQDGVLGDEWAKIGSGLLGLLNGDCGRLDCGTLDGIIRSTLKDEGFDPENL